MNPDDAEEYTGALGQIVAGGWRQVALGERLGVPEALGLSTREWVEGRLGGYVRLSLPERREAVAELTANGMTQREVADVLGVDQGTVSRDANASEQSHEQEPLQAPDEDASVAESLLDQAAQISDLLETVKMERRPERPTPGVVAHPVAAFLWGRLGEIRDLDATDAGDDQRGDVIEALDKWAEQLGRLREEISP